MVDSIEPIGAEVMPKYRWLRPLVDRRINCKKIDTVEKARRSHLGIMSNARQIRSSSDVKGITLCGSEEGNRTRVPGFVSIILRGYPSFFTGRP